MRFVRFPSRPQVIATLSRGKARPTSILWRPLLGALFVLSTLLAFSGCSDDAGAPQDGAIGGETLGCGPQSCKGCCIGDRCQDGTKTTACGTAGQACVICRDGESCVDGRCLIPAGKCNTQNCPEGCCQGDQCLPGTTQEACGEGGHICSHCGSSSTCVAHQCGCDAASCPGCCDGATCKPGDTHDACGKGGAACIMCQAKESCSKVARVCQVTTGCDATNCNGCCDGANCELGDTVGSCGKGGLACTTCGPQETCEAGVCNDPAICGPTNCAGCCAKSVCQGGTALSQCGVKGERCQTCAPHETCDATQGCVFDNDKLWSITVVSATLDPTKSWDVYPANIAPDVLVSLAIDTLDSKTNVMDNTYTPVWNEVLGKVKASALLSLPLEVEVIDWDPVKNETIGTCKATVTAKVLTAGGNSLIKGCGPDGYVQAITFKFAPLSP